jgi:hypothetical protein
MVNLSCRGNDNKIPPALYYAAKNNNIIRVYPLGESGITVFYNNDRIYSDTLNTYILKSSLNRVIEGKRGIALFLLVNCAPSFDRIYGFDISPHKAELKSTACFFDKESRNDGPAPFTDMDNDGYPEYGGFDITEVPSSYPDSIYYNPSSFFEIKDGRIYADTSLIKRMDIKENGIYLKHPSDSAGLCCITIKNPKRITTGYNQQKTAVTQ